MEYETEMRIRNELSPKERLLWSGRPKQGFLLRPSDAFMIPWNLILTGFVVFWVAFAGRASLLFLIWGIPFLAAGLYMVLGRFIVDAIQRGKTYCGVTNERIIIISGLINRRVKSLAIDSVSNISLTEKKNGQGTITFGPTGPWYRQRSFISLPGMPEPTPSFESIPNAKDVYDQIRSIQNE